MDKKEIIGLIAAIAGVFIMIFIVSAIRGKTDEPDADASDAPDTSTKTDEPVMTDIWDVLHEMQATTAPLEEPGYAIVTGIDENGELYAVTDENGGVVTEIIQVPVNDPEDVPQDGGNTTVTTAVASSDPPVIAVSPDQTYPENSDAPYFIVAPAE